MTAREYGFYKIRYTGYISYQRIHRCPLGWKGIEAMRTGRAVVNPAGNHDNRNRATHCMSILRTVRGRL
jgi:hypothetical protein